MSAGNCIKETYEFLDVLFDTIKVRHDRKREIAIKYAYFAQLNVLFTEKTLSLQKIKETYCVREPD